jgi:hypothetical protein
MSFGRRPCSHRPVDLLDTESDAIVEAAGHEVTESLW